MKSDEIHNLLIKLAKQIKIQIRTSNKGITTLVLVACSGLIFTGYIDFETAFYVGLVLFAVTAVTWWFWTIYTIRQLVKTLNRASKNLQEVREEFKSVAKDIEAMRND